MSHVRKDTIKMMMAQEIYTLFTKAGTKNYHAKSVTTNLSILTIQRRLKLMMIVHIHVMTDMLVQMTMNV